MSFEFKQIVLATHNTGKTRELTDFFSPLSITFQNASNWGLEAPEETGATYLENALLKARYVSAKTGLPALGDDAGLCVAALNGNPGIYSARYGGPDLTGIERCEKLLGELQGVQDRRAYFYCVLVLLRSPEDPAPLIGFGQWNGDILTAARGGYGFGYDPVFWVADRQCSAAELKPEQKNVLSHRAQACQMLLTQMMKGQAETPAATTTLTKKPYTRAD